MSAATAQRQGFDRSRKSATKGYTRIACSQCAAIVVNNTPLHEAGCPNETAACKGCGETVPKHARYCADCS